MVRCTELTRFTPALFAPRFRLSVGTLVTHGKGGILSLNQDRVEPPSSGEDEDLSETKALYVSGDIDTVVELESELEDVLDGEDSDEKGGGEDGNA